MRLNGFLADTWLTDLIDNAWDAFSLVPTLVAVIGFAAIVRAWYRRTLGRRRDRYERLARLGANAQLTFFTSVLGEPPAMKRALEGKVRKYVTPEEFARVGERENWEVVPPDDDEIADEEDETVEVLATKGYIECIFIDRDYYVQVLCDEEETVLGFSVTMRSSRFRPTFTGHPPRPAPVGRRVRRIGRRRTGLFRVRLGRTRFAALGIEHDWQPEIRVSSGVRTYAYSEAYYFGNPGSYQHYVFTASGVALQRPMGAQLIGELGQNIPNGTWFGGMRGDDRDLSPAAKRLLGRLRREAIVTTYTIVGPHQALDDWPVNFGPHGDEVRTLP
jgi:hypothetical protein